PVPGGEDATETYIPIGFGIGKRLGSAKRLSLALFVRPEYMIRIHPEPERGDTFWDELGRRREGRGVLGLIAATPLLVGPGRSEGRGVLGLIAATPFLYGTGGIEISTRDYQPEFVLGIGVTF